MVRFFDKLKSSFGRKQPSTPPEDPPSTVHPSPDVPASTAPDAVGTALATFSPAVVEEASSAPGSSETTSMPESSPVVRTPTVSVKRARMRVRRVRRPRPVIRERHMTPPEESQDSEDSEDREKPMVRPEPVADTEAPEKPVLHPESVTDIETPENSDSREEPVSSPEPVAEIEAPEKPASSPRHVITRRPMAQKRLRKVRVVKPKVRVVR